MVRAGDTAYVVGWKANGAAALWHVDATGVLSRRTAPPGAPGRPGSADPRAVFQLAFGDSDTGVAITGVTADRRHADHQSLFVTDDGAHTWAKVTLPTAEQPEQVAVGGGAMYVVTSNCVNSAAACRHAAVWSIDESGARPPHPAAGLPGKLDSSEGADIAAYGRAVWVTLGTSGPDPTSLHSSDGGRTWHRFDTGLCTWTDMVATSPRVLWTTCATGMLQHFTRTTGPTAPAQVFEETGGTSGSALLPLSDRVAYAVIADRHGTRVDVTMDAGRTTSTVSPIPRSMPGDDLRVALISDHVGYLVAQSGGELYRTDDGARTWHEIASPRH